MHNIACLSEKYCPNLRLNPRLSGYNDSQWMRKLSLGDRARDASSGREMCLLETGPVELAKYYDNYSNSDEGECHAVVNNVNRSEQYWKED